MTSRRPRAFRMTMVAAAVSLAACTTGAGAADRTPEASGLATSVAPAAALGRDALAALRKGDYTRAQALATEGLSLRPTDAQLHLINAMCYHQRWFMGEASARDFARTGYEIALNHDPDLWPAAWLLGSVLTASGQYGEAREYYARALVLQRNVNDLKLEYAQAAYLNGDPVAAYGTLSSLDQRNAVTQRALAITAASTFRFEEAERHVNALASAGAPAAEVDAIRQRIGDWRENLQLAAARIDAGQGATMSDAGAPPTGPLLMAQSSNIYEQLKARDQQERAAVAAIAAKPAEGAAAGAAAPAGSTRMALIDVTILLTEESYTANKGVNLLTGLQLMLGGDGLPFLQRGFTRTPTQADALTFTRTITIPSVTYALNIANVGKQRSEVLARPTLIALDGKESTFSNGNRVSVTLTGQFGGSLEDRDVGLTMSVTPTFISDTRVQLAVSVSRSFFVPVAASAAISGGFQVSQTKVSSNVAVNLGETIILSGLTEKGNTTVTNATPGLGDVPIVQYLFNQRTDRQSANSVMVMLTPRAPVNTDQINAGAAKDGPGEHTLKHRYPSWFRLDNIPNWVEVLNHMKSNAFYHQFRKGDLYGRHWDLFDSTPERIQRALKYLYY